MSSKSVLITGAAGFVGSHLAERCLDLGWRVTALDAFTDYYDEALKRANVARLEGHPDYRLIEDDLVGADLDALLSETSIVFHLAAQPGVRASWDEFGVYTHCNVSATQRLLHAARGHQLERVVLASSSSIYGDAETLPTPEDTAPRPVSPYGMTKVATEHLAYLYWRNFGVPTICLRYFTVYGPRQRPDMAFNRLIAAALDGTPFTLFGDGQQSRDFTFVADAVSGTVAAGQRGRPGSVYNIGGGSRRTMNDVLDTLADILGEPVRVHREQSQRGDARDTAADIGRARAELHYVPAFDFTAGLNAQFEWQRATSTASAGELPGARA